MKRIIAILPLIALLCCDTNLRSKQDIFKEWSDCRNKCMQKKADDLCYYECDAKKGLETCLTDAKDDVKKQEKCKVINKANLECQKKCVSGSEGQLCRNSCAEREGIERDHAECLKEAKDNTEKQVMCEKRRLLATKRQDTYDLCVLDKCKSNKKCPSKGICILQDELQKQYDECFVKYEKDNTKSAWCKERAECNAKCELAKDYPCHNKCNQKYDLHWCLEHAKDESERKKCENSGEACQKTCAPGTTGDFCRAKCKLQDELNSCFAVWGKENETRIKSCRETYNQDLARLKCDASCPEGETGDICRYKCDVEQAGKRCLADDGRAFGGKEGCGKWAACALACDTKEKAEQACVDMFKRVNEGEDDEPESTGDYAKSCHESISQNKDAQQSYCNGGCALKIMEAQCDASEKDTEKRKQCKEKARQEMFSR